MIAAGSYPTRSDAAQLAELLLWAAGIPYEIEAGDAGDASSASRFDPIGRVRLLVEEPDAEDASWALMYRPETRKERP